MLTVDDYGAIRRARRDGKLISAEAASQLTPEAQNPGQTLFLEVTSQCIDHEIRLLRAAAATSGRARHECRRVAVDEPGKPDQFGNQPPIVRTCGYTADLLGAGNITIDKNCGRVSR